MTIAYQLLGKGPPNLVRVPSFAHHVEMFWDLPGFAYTYRRIASFARLALFHQRGTGPSDRTLGTGSLEDRMGDATVVMDAAGMDSAVIVGVSEGGALAAMLAATFPQRAEALVLFGAAAGGSGSTPGSSPRSRRAGAPARSSSVSGSTAQEMSPSWGASNERWAPPGPWPP